MFYFLVYALIPFELVLGFEVYFEGSQFCPLFVIQIDSLGDYLCYRVCPARLCVTFGKLHT
jgi:hypothetical protein